MSETTQRPALHLTEACWPVLEFVTNFDRQVKHGSTAPADQVRFEALSALRDAEDLARDDPVTERLWHDHVRPMMVYLIDYKMLNTDWEGCDYWSAQPFETDPNVLDHPQALGGEDFFTKCDELQREYELAERRDRHDKDELAELLTLFFVCLRLGFKGQYHDRPLELGDYTRRLFSRLPGYARTRDERMFPDAYRHNQEMKVNYNIGMRLTIFLAIFAGILCIAFVTFWVSWDVAVGEIADAAEQWRQNSATIVGGK